MLDGKNINTFHYYDPIHAYFLVYGFLGNKINRNFSINPSYEEFNSLNERVLNKMDLEVSALSAVNFWKVADHYYLLKSGSTQRFDVGAILVSKKRYTKDEIRDLTIGIPGKSFSGYFYFRLFFEPKNVVEIRFDKIIDAVLRDEVDAGLLIPGPTTTGLYEKMGLIKIASVFEEWKRKVGDLPMPMGTYVVRKKDFSIEEAIEIRKAFQDSIRYAQSHHKEAFDYAMQFAKGSDPKYLQEFIDGCKLIYDMGEIGKSAIKKVHEIAKEKGLIDYVPEINPI